MSQPNVAFIRSELAALLPLYKLIRDCLAGETAIKAARETYLPCPFEISLEKGERRRRYNGFLSRAVFYNVARSTLNGLVGQVFSKDYMLKIPEGFDFIEKDINGEGVTLEQQSKKAEATVLAYSRAGLLVDYPKTKGKTVTVRDIKEGKIRPVIKLYSPLSIINWRFVKMGAVSKLGLVVIAEDWPYFDDGFEIKNAIQFRVLKLDANLEYVQEIWQEESPTTWDGYSIPKNKKFVSKGVYEPVDSKGKRLTEIPFEFIGSQNNDPHPDLPNFYDLCSLNIAHYQNSANYEQMLFKLGQATVWASGLSENWVKEVLGGVLAMGSDGGIPLPKDAAIGLLETQSDSMLFEALEHKERQMVALGAKLVEQKTVERTAYETGIESKAELSTLSSVTKNVSHAYQTQLKRAADWHGVASESIEFELNSDFYFANITPEERKQVVEEWQKGAITFGEMRVILQKANIATETKEAAEAAIKKAEEEKLKTMLEFSESAEPAANAA